MGNKAPYPGKDIIDSRDVIDAIRWLDLGDADEDTFDIEADEKAEEPKLDDDERALLRLHREGQDLFGSEWRDGVGLIRDDYFETYARDFAEDIGAINGDEGWPSCHIDWKAAAEALQMDYSSIDFDGTEYWGRS